MSSQNQLSLYFKVTNIVHAQMIKTKSSMQTQLTKKMNKWLWRGGGKLRENKLLLGKSEKEVPIQ